MNGISIDNLATATKNFALLVSVSDEIISTVETMLAATGFPSLIAKTDEQVFCYLEQQKISIILIDSTLSYVSCNQFIFTLRNNSSVQNIPIIIFASIKDETQLENCMSAGNVGVLFKPFTALALSNKIATLEKIAELKRLYKGSLNEQIVARRILNNAIDERTTKFGEIELLLRSKAIFSGDLFLTARHPDGSVNVLLADFTGHGLPSAIGALPVADVFCTMTDKGFELGYILENVNKKLHTLLPTSMFMACSVLNISNDLKQVKIWNGGMPDIYIREYKTGGVRHKIASSEIPLGITETISNQYKFKCIDLTPGDQIILFTDGLVESLNRDDDMFGEHRLEACLQKHNKDQSVFTALINTFDEFRGDIVAMDDIALVCIPCTSKLMYVNNIDISKEMHIACSEDNRWHWYLELAGLSLYEINPVHYVIAEIHKISGRSINTEKLSDIISVLYKNVIEHEQHEDSSQVTNLYKVRKTCINSGDAYIKIGIKKVYHNAVPALLIHMEDSGKALAQDDLLNLLDNISNNTSNNTEPHDEEFPLVYELNKLSGKKGFGNRFEAIIFENNRLVSDYG
ncbi:Serine phosphatase RsbU, regulator of sigma subunit [hydrothermal vent metagenome]|uniref:Serine phosphatase RsbU, regulator of sigma subunit n=1 Tax=hydrothermal vent metagenome TaxID=652676 RepID=A0A3B0WPU1_9ZZZZ